jgi:hypothetical protein
MYSELCSGFKSGRVLIKQHFYVNSIKGVIKGLGSNFKKKTVQGHWLNGAQGALRVAIHANDSVAERRKTSNHRHADFQSRNLQCNLLILERINITKII